MRVADLVREDGQHAGGAAERGQLGGGEAGGEAGGGAVVRVDDWGGGDGGVPVVMGEEIGGLPGS